MREGMGRPNLRKLKPWVTYSNPCYSWLTIKLGEDDLYHYFIWHVNFPFRSLKELSGRPGFMILYYTPLCFFPYLHDRWLPKLCQANTYDFTTDLGFSKRRKWICDCWRWLVPFHLRFKIFLPPTKGTCVPGQWDRALLVCSSGQYYLGGFPAILEKDFPELKFHFVPGMSMGSAASAVPCWPFLQFSSTL